MTNTPWGGKIFHRETTGSTMDDAQALEDLGEPYGTLVWADSQSAGRGRNPGRIWVGAPGASLLFTVFWDPSGFFVPEFAPSLTIGLGICLWIEALNLPSQPTITLKWPNDVYLDDRKIAGILVRRRWGTLGPLSVHGGVGINLLPPGELGDFRTRPGALSEAGRILEPEEALGSLLPALATALSCPDPRSECEKRLWRKGREFCVSLPRENTFQTGILIGLDPTGGLVLDTAEGRRTVISGE